MRTRAIAVTLAILASGLAAHTAAAENWPAWRGPNFNGVTLEGDPPVTWSESENVKWKVEIQGSGSSTPIVWEDKLFLTTAFPTAEEPPAQKPPATEGRRRGPPRTPPPTVPYKFNVICLDRNTGELLWERTAREAIPHEGHHPTGNFASNSAVTDGKLLWASFGSRGLHCYDLDGNHQWSNDLVQMKKRMTFGEGCSPVLAGDAIIVVMDHDGDSKIMAFNKKTGAVLWEKPRDEHTAWATPLAVEVNGALQVVTCASKLIRSYDVKTGDLLWETGKLTLNAIPTPVSAFGNVYCTSGFRGYTLKAIELGHTGDLSDTDAIVWEIDKGTPYVASPILYGENLYVLASLKPVLSCYNAKTGAPIFEDQKIDGLKTIYASPTGAAGRIYIADRAGTTAVIKNADTFEVLATNKLDEGFDASPIIVGDTLYLRGQKHLYCIEKP